MDHRAVIPSNSPGKVPFPVVKWGMKLMGGVAPKQAQAAGQLPGKPQPPVGCSELCSATAGDSAVELTGS